MAELIKWFENDTIFLLENRNQILFPYIFGLDFPEQEFCRLRPSKGETNFQERVQVWLLCHAPFQSWLWNKMLSFFEARSRGCPFFTVFMDATWCFVQSCRTSGVQLLRWDSKSAVRFEWKSKKNLTQLASKTREWQQGQKVQCKWKGSVSAHVSISFVFSCDFLILSDRANELSSPPAMLNVLPFHCFMSAGLDASHWRQLRLLGGSLWLDRKCVSWLDFMRSVTCRCNMFRTGFDGDLWWSEVLFCFFDDFKPLALLACFAFRSKPYCTLWCKCVDSSKSALSLKACSAHSWHS